MVFIIIATYNARDYIRWCLDSIYEQTYREIHTLVVDNASIDGTVEVVREYPNVAVIRNRNNLGFCKACNQGLQMALESNTNQKPEYVLFLNQDTILTPKAVEELVHTARQHPEAAQFGPKLLRYRMSHETDDRGYPETTTVIDSAGIYPKSSFQFISRGEGQEDLGQFEEGEVWGFPGTCNLIRSSDWELIKTRTREYLDEDLFMYKDDVDLAFRLHKLGLKSWFVPSSVVYHHRTERGALGDLTFWNFFNNVRVARRKKQYFSTFLGYRNQLLVLYKHLAFGQFARKGVPILWFEFRKFIYFLFTQPHMLIRAWKEFFKLRTKMKKKKQIVKEVMQDGTGHEVRGMGN